MGWLSPAFLFGALAVALPLYLHLLRRTSAAPQRFSSLMLFEPQQRSTARRRRIAHWALLLLRLLLLLLLAAAFAQPYLRRPIPGVAPEKLLVLAVDDSFSMRAGTRLADARRAALAVIAAKRSQDRAQVLALGGGAQILTQPLQDAAPLAAAVNGIRAGDARGSFSLLAGVLRTIAANERTPIELHVFSDMQRTDMPADFSELRLPPNVTLVLHPVVRASTPNWTVENVVAPAQVWDPAQAQIVATVAGYATPAATRTVSFLINGRVVGRQRVTVPASGRVSATLTGFEIPYGLARGAVRIDGADALPADDEYDFVMQRAERAHGLFVHQSSDSTSGLYFRSALVAAADAAVMLDDIPVQQLRSRDLSPYAFVVVSDVAGLSPEVQARLTAYVRGGGRLLLTLGTTAAQQPSVPVFDARILERRHYARDPERFAAVADVDGTYPPAGPAGQWSGIKFYYAARVDATGARVGLRLADQTALLLEKTLGAGRVVLFTSGFDNLTSDLPLQPVFVAFVDRLVSYLSRRESRVSAHLVGDFIDLRSQADERGSVDVLAPDGTRPLSLKEAASARTWQLSSAGFYELRLADGRRDLVAANVSRLESDLTPASPDVLELWQAGAAGGGGGAAPVAAAAVGTAAAQVPRSLWWYAMVLVLAAALAESLGASRYLHALRESS